MDNILEVIYSQACRIKLSPSSGVKVCRIKFYFMKDNVFKIRRDEKLLTSLGSLGNRDCSWALAIGAGVAMSKLSLFPYLNRDIHTFFLAFLISNSPQCKIVYTLLLRNRVVIITRNVTLPPWL